MMGIPVWGSGPSFVLTESGGATFTLNCKGDYIYIYIVHVKINRRIDIMTYIWYMIYLAHLYDVEMPCYLVSLCFFVDSQVPRCRPPLKACWSLSWLGAQRNAILKCSWCGTTGFWDIFFETNLDLSGWLRDRDRTSWMKSGSKRRESKFSRVSTKRSVELDCSDVFCIKTSCVKFTHGTHPKIAQAGIPKQYATNRAEATNAMVWFGLSLYQQSKHFL
jgi:hypothetical protein